jgi:hypothetical protein
VTDVKAKREIRKLADAPPDEELSIRLTYSRTYKPNPQDYANGDHLKTMFGYLLHDKECVDEGYYMLDEAIDLQGEGLEIIFELVDGDGKVWSEYYDLPEEES